jgi:hypothetical protein
MGFRRTARQRAAPLALALMAMFAVGAAPAGAAYQASVYSNTSAFTKCEGITTTIPYQLRALAADGLYYLGYTPSSYEGANFTRSRVLGRIAADRALYVHSHGDHYSVGWGFREDNGTCTQGIVGAPEIRSRRTTAANLVIASTCHLAEAASDFPDAFGIPRVKTNSSGAPYLGQKFFMGYIGSAWTVDMLAFETNFWRLVKSGKGLGDAFTQAKQMTAWKFPTRPDWYGQYTFSGAPFPIPPCPLCL